MSKRCVLVIEDDAAIRRGLCDALEFEGYATRQAGRGDEGRDLAIRGSFDLLLLDLILPGRSGLEILEEVRGVHPTLPIIILTARGDEADRIHGLKLGADDYVVKPFSVRELTARIEAVLRRSPERPSDIARVPLPGGTADLDQQVVAFDDGETVALSVRERDILRYLASRSGRAISRDELMTRVWGIDPQGLQTRAIDMQIARLREKLRDDPANPRLIRTIRGKGYLFTGNGHAGSDRALSRPDQADT